MKLQVANSLFKHALPENFANSKFKIWIDIFSIDLMLKCMLNSNRLLNQRNSILNLKPLFKHPYTSFTHAIQYEIKLNKK